MCCIRSDESFRLSLWFVVFAIFAIGCISTPEVAAQGSSNDLGNGGRHTIQGRLYVSTGRRSQTWGLKIRLNNSSAGEIWVMSDQTGTFTFRNLNPGSYQVTVEGGDAFEDYTENIVIDDPGSSTIRSTVRMGGMPRIINVQVYLRPKAVASPIGPLQVISAKWASFPKDVLESYERGQRLVNEGNDREAEPAFRRSLEISPSFAPAHTALGRILQRAGNLNAAIAEWKDALRYDAQDFDASLNLGIAYLNLRKYSDAEPPLVNAAYLEPSAVTPHYYIGIAFVMKNDLDVAMKAFEKAKELNGGKSLPAIHKYLGRIYGAKNKPKEAIFELETYLKLAPKAQDVEKVRKDIADLKNKQN